MKPVALVERAIRNSSKSRDIVLDPFGGSGTTLIAAERAGRRARLIELDPKYVDVIVQRWQASCSGACSASWALAILSAGGPSERRRLGIRCIGHIGLGFRRLFGDVDAERGEAAGVATSVRRPRSSSCRQTMSSLLFAWTSWIRPFARRLLRTLPAALPFSFAVMGNTQRSGRWHAAVRTTS
jgi:hypothetical protein